MTFTLDGARPRYFHERVRIAAQDGFPLKDDLSADARRRIIREIVDRCWSVPFGRTERYSFVEAYLVEVRKVLGLGPLQQMGIDETLAKLDLDRFLTCMEVGVALLQQQRGLRKDVEVLQSILADDLSTFRFVDKGGDDRATRFQIEKIENAHLRREIVDRTFELTQIAELASAQGDYADAWRHYSRGDLDDAVANAGKAVESACKAMIKKVDPTSTPDNLNLGHLVTLLVQKDVIPTAMTSIANHLEGIYRASGGLRNQAGDGAHGSVNPTSPEESVALLGLRLSGTLIAFLAERWLQIK